MTLEPAYDTLNDLLNSHGKCITLAPGEQRVFDEPSAVWFLVDGSIDIFAVQRKSGRQTGPRDHLCTLSSGSLIWGIDQNLDEDGIALLALGAEEAQLMRVDARTVDGWGQDRSLAGAIAPALDQWITGLSQGVTKYISPRKPPRRSLSPGEELAIEENDRIISRRQVTWALLEMGSVFYIDIREIAAIDGPAFIPLTAQGWLRAGSARSLRGLATESVLRFGQIDSQMAQFHTWLFHNLAYGFRNAQAMENARMKRRAGWVQGQTEGTFVKFAKLFGEEVFRPAEGGMDDALFQACAAVGKASGIPVVMPPYANRRRAEEAPLSITEIAAASQFRLRRVALTDDWWTRENGCLVAFLAETNQPVALLQNRPDRMVLYNPRTGDTQAVTRDVAATVASAAFTFYPSLPSRPTRFRDLIHLCLGQCRTDLLGIFLLGAAGGIIATAIPIATGYVFDEAIPGHETAQMVQMGLAILASAFAAAIFEFSRNVAQLRIEGRLSGTIQAALMDRLLRLPANFFGLYSSGDLAQRTTMVETARKSLTGVVLGSIVSGGFSVFSFALLLFYSPAAALAGALLVLVLAAATLFAGLKIMHAVTDVLDVSGRLNGMVLEIINGINKIRIAGAEERAFNIWGADFFTFRAGINDCRKRQLGFSVFWSVYEILSLACIFAVMSSSIASGLTTGRFLAFIAAFSGFLSSIFTLGRSIIAILAVVPLFQRMEPILAANPENDPSKSDPGRLAGDIEVSAVHFRYAPNLPNVLNGLTLSIRAGEMVALVGPSGSGKSTLVRLLLGLGHPDQGAIYYDGRDLRGLNLRAVRRQLGAVLQNGRLMPGSLYENIRSVSGASLEECWEAAKQAGLADDIRAMPMGMHTVMTDGATTLSGGQVQRLLIARALVGKPAILLFDEATSALDNETQSIVMNTLNQLSVTRIVIAHRLSTIRNADRIYVLKNGLVVEDGTFTELMEGGNLFTALAYRQKL